jgi:isopentenyldiphosphate isomerase/intracellular septation protein A
VAFVDIRTVLKALLPSFLPLIVFVVVESLFGEAAGLAAGLAMGAGEFLYVLARERRIDPFVIVDTAFLGIAGALSLILHDEIFFKLKPVIIEAVMGGALTLALFLPPAYLRKYLENQLKGMRIGDESMPAMRRSLVLLVGVLAIHMALTLAAAIWFSTAVWGFVSGGLLYILFGLVVLAQFARARWPRRSAGSREMLPLVDDDGRILGKATRNECHRSPGMLHPVVHLHIMDGKGGIYLQKRSAAKDTEPGKWDTAMAGHIAWGESLETALARELREELGVTLMAIEAAGGKIAPLFRYRIDTPTESELVHVHGATYSGELFPDGVEVETGRYWKISEVFAARGSGIFTPSLERDLELFSDSAARAEAEPSLNIGIGPAPAPATEPAALAGPAPAAPPARSAAAQAAAQAAARAVAAGARKALYSSPDRPL